MSNQATIDLTPLYTSATSQLSLQYAMTVSQQIQTQGLQTLSQQSIIAHLLRACVNKTSGMEREGGFLGLVGLVRGLGKAVLPFLGVAVGPALEAHADKGAAVQEAAGLFLEELFNLVDQWSLPILMDAITPKSGKWQGKIAALGILSDMAARFPTCVGDALPELIPAVTNCMHDTKAVLSQRAFEVMTGLCKVVSNPDITPHVPLLVDCMAHPDHVIQTVLTLSATTFVAEVTGPALALMVPLLVRALNDRSAAVMRPTTVIADNLFKLVRDPLDAGQFMGQLMPGLDRIIETAAFPEIRGLAVQARATLVSAAEGLERVEVTSEEVYADLSQLMKGRKVVVVGMVKESLIFISKVISNLIRRENFKEAVWLSSLEGLVATVKKDTIQSVIIECLKGFHLKYRNSQKYGDDDPDEGELLCDCEFSLAYGGMMLLNNTRLRLRRGQRYGLCGPNGAGKSTLMRAISLGKVDGFPSQDELKCVFVEHALQGDEAALSVLDFLHSDKGLTHYSRNEVKTTLQDVGFDEFRREQSVGALSGGWKMKLELARAMLLKADILLLDEPTNHLDVANVAWLVNYLVTNTQITSLIVSHDSLFLDSVCTYITHYEHKKLLYYKGNLSNFVERKPEAKSYYTLAATSIKFSFPPPSVLLGIRSNTKAIMKMSNCTFTYPGTTTSSMKDVSVQLSLSSRVGVVGANGAGKSTMIKLLTGELIPQEGVVWKHPNIRVGYVAQHAFHHLEEHLELTANQYIQWRYQGGQDREVLEKANRHLSAQDQLQMDVKVECMGHFNKIELILGRQKLKKSFQYEVKWLGLPHKHNKWLNRDYLLECGFQKLIQAFDDQEASREGQGYRELLPSVIRAHIEQLGLSGDIADNNAMSGLSGGQKVKVVLAAAMWNNPHMLVLDEPTNYLDRESLGGLAVAIKEWGGAVIMISHNTEFVSALCPEIWEIAAGALIRKGKVQIIDDNVEEAEKIAKSVSKSSGKKKKLSRNDVKAQEVRRRARHMKWLSEGGEKVPDTEEEE